MHSVTFWQHVTYHHVPRCGLTAPPACPECGNHQVSFHSWRQRIVEHLAVEQPCYLVLQLPKYGCRTASCPRKYFTPPIAEAAAMQQVRALGAEPTVIVSDLWTAYPEALRRVWPRARRQLCWFHVMQWVTRKLARLLKEYGQTLPEEQRTALNRLRFCLLASPEKQARLTQRQQRALATAWELLRGSVVDEAIQLRNDLRVVLNTSADGWEARRQFDRLRKTWPARFHFWTFRLGEPLPERPSSEPATGLRAYLEEIMAFFVRHFERMITYLDHPGVPRTSNHAERANRRYRQVSRSRYGWKTKHGQRAMLAALQGFDSS